MFLSEGLNLLITALVIFAFLPLRKVFFREPKPSQIALPRERIDYFDFLKGIAIISVIIIHVAYYFQHLNRHNNDFFINTFTDLFRFAIPFFFICSGLLLASFPSPPSAAPDKFKRGLLGRYYTDKFVRIFIPYLIMNILFAAYLNPSFEEFIVYVLSGTITPPYYFVIVLLIFYLLFPWISRFKDNKTFLMASFFISFVSFFLPNLIVYGPLYLSVSLFFFFVYGMYMRNYFLFRAAQTVKNEVILWLVIILLYLWITLGFSGFYYNNQFFYGIAVFNLFFIFKDKIMRMPDKIFKAICSFGRASLWIFLTHFPTMFLIYSILSIFNFNYYIFYLLTGLFSIIICYCIGKISFEAYNRILKVLGIRI